MSEAGRRILIVEDQRLIAADLENTLKKLGYVVVGNVPAGEDAIRKSDEARPELVLMDVRLRGEMDGIQAAEIIRDRFNVPVVYLTAYADEETILRAKKTTPFGYLVKPFNERELRATIEIAFYTHQMERTLADERAKRQGAEEFKSLVDGVRDYAIFMLDRNGRITTWNSGAERLKGYKAEEIIGEDFSVFYPEEERQAGHPKRLLETALRDGRVEEENWRVRKDATRFWASDTISAICNESGTLIGFAKVTRDLSERRLAEEQREAERHEAERVLRESEERFRLLVDEVRDYAIFFLDLEGHVMTWNAGAQRFKGYRADEIIGQSFVRFYVPEDVIAGRPGQLLRRATEVGVATDEGLRVRKDGSRFWASVVLTALHDKSGRLRGFAKVTRDVTEQKHAERRMAILADASRLLGESLDSGQILFTISRMAVPDFADGVVIHLRDPEGEPRLGLFHATNLEMLAAVRDLQVRGAYRVAAPSRRVMRTGRSELHPALTPDGLRGQDMDDELAFLILRFGISSTIHVPVTVAGSPVAVLLFAAAGTKVYDEHDLVFAEELARRASTAMHNAELFQTAKKERARAEEAAELRERLVAVVGHDLRQPLTAIDIRLDILRRSRKDLEFLEDLDGLRASSRRMSRMIEQILDFTRSRLGGGLELVLAPMDLREALVPIVDKLRAAHPSVTIQVQCPRLRGAWDRDRLEQVFSNLIGNALAHGDPDTPVTVTAGAEGLRAWIQVHNEGPPIPQALQSALFNPFRMGERSSRSPAGLGLGLYISNEVIHRHGGQIEIRSTAAEGTTFRVVLPCEVVGHSRDQGSPQ
jgi:PAS domain S-box-containing protein